MANSLVVYLNSWRVIYYQTGQVALPPELNELKRPPSGLSVSKRFARVLPTAGRDYFHSLLPSGGYF